MLACDDARAEAKWFERAALALALRGVVEDGLDGVFRGEWLLATDDERCIREE
jgi:chemotaxis response regulator CheB